MPLGADDALPVALGESVELCRIEGPPGAIDKAFDAEFLAFGAMAGKTIKLLRPERMLFGLGFVKQAGVEDRIERDLRLVGGDDTGVGVVRWSRKTGQGVKLFPL